MSRYTTKKTNVTPIVRNTGIVFFFSIGAKLLSLIRESAIAAYAGTSVEADAYYMVQGIYVVFELGLSTAIFQSFFPLYKQLSLDPKGQEQKKRFANAAITLLLILAIGLGIIEIAGRRVIVSFLAPGFSSAAKALAGELIWFSAPMLFFVIAAECVSTILRAHDHFSRSQMRELATHIVAIAVIVLLYQKFGVVALGLGMLLGAVARLAIQLPGLGKIYRFRPCVDLKNKDLGEMFRRIPAALVTAGATQLKGIADKMIASLASVGSVSALNYGHKIETALGGLISTAIATGLYPEMVALQAKGEKKKLGELVDRSIGVFALIAIPLCVGCCLWSEEIVSLIYERGNFGANEVQITANVFAAYMLGTFFSGASAIVSNVFYGVGDTKTPMKINCVDLVLNVILNLTLFRPLGVTGLAVATSISGVVAYVLRMYAVQKHLDAEKTRFGKEFLKIVFSSIVAGTLCKIIVMGLPLGMMAIQLGLAVMLMIVLYFALILALKSANMAFLIGVARKRFGK